MKYVLVIGDGMADNPVPCLGGLTPLEKAKTPFLDALAARGEVGSVTTCPEGLPPGSDTAILSIFGNDPRSCYTGRSPLEAAAEGRALLPGEVSYRCNLVTLEEGVLPYGERKLLSHSGGSIGGADAKALMDSLVAHPEFASLAQTIGLSICPAPSFRQIAVQRGGALAGLVLAPPHEHLEEPLGPWLPAGSTNAAPLRALMECAYSCLDQHPVNLARRRAGKLPANGIWFWAQGTAVALPSFFERYHKKGTVISAVPLCHGIAQLSGLKVERVEGATGELNTNYQGKVDAALQALRSGDDFAAIHIEAPDECTHNGDLPGKIQAIEWLDSRVLAPLCAGLEHLNEDYRLLFLSDHKTLTATRGHNGDPVPFLFYDSRVDTAAGLPYNEKNGACGRSLPEGAATLMPLLFE